MGNTKTSRLIPNGRYAIWYRWVTAALSIDKLETVGLTAEEGDIVVSGLLAVLAAWLLLFWPAKDFQSLLAQVKKRNTKNHLA